MVGGPLKGGTICQRSAGGCGTQPKPGQTTDIPWRAARHSSGKSMGTECAEMLRPWKPVWVFDL